MLPWIGVIAISALSHPTAEADPFEHHPEITVSLWTSEPSIVDPVALCFAANGDCFVVEMRDYPYGHPTPGKPAGTIRLLRDKDGDGKAESSVIFAEGLSFPTSVTPWRDGILVAAPPQILYLADTDGDDVSDVRKVILDGFRRGVTDGNLSGLHWGLDNRVHGTKGASSAVIHAPLNDVEPLRLGDHDFAFHPDTGTYERTSESSSGFGILTTPGGHVFSNYNIDYLQQHIIPLRYYEGIAALPDFEATTNISDHGESARIYPISEARTRPNHPEQAGHFSAASGMAYIESGIFPPSLHQSIFVFDVVGNLVHRNRLREDGPVFRGRRTHDEAAQEFLASRDPNFRPVSMVHGPDGALYLADMQRDVIEHPDYIPPRMRRTLDIRAGDDRGRIWRIAPKNGEKVPRVNLAALEAVALAPYLISPHSWQAETAHRLIVERWAKDTAETVRSQFAESDHAYGRVRVLRALEGIGQLTTADIRKALRDSSPYVREQGLILAESIPLHVDILQRLGDSHPRVRFQAALSSRFVTVPDKSEALKRLFARDIESKWTRLAVLCAIGASASELLPVASAHPAATRDVAESATQSPRILATIAKASPSPALLEGLHAGWKRQPPSAAVRQAMPEHLKRWSTEVTDPFVIGPLLTLHRMFGVTPSGSVAEAATRAARIARSAEAAIPRRNEAIALLSRIPSSDSQAALLTVLESGPTELQLAAIGALRSLGHPDTGTEVVKRWRKLSPQVRPEMVRLLLSKRKYHGALLGGLESETLLFRELNLDLEQRRTLLRWSSGDIRKRAKKLFSDDEYQNRRKIVDEWLGKLPDSGDAQNGRKIFSIHCSSCHRAGGEGHDVGPQLTAVSHRSIEDLLSHILDPNMAINAKYATCSVETESGEIVLGILAEENAKSLTLLLPLGQKKTIDRSQIREFRATEISLMPQGLEAVIPPTAMRDLIEFLQHPSPDQSAG